MVAPRHLLVLRFSALGDIAMTVPVIKNLLQQNPLLEITFVSVPYVKPLFEGIDRLYFYAADIKKEYKGFFGLYQLSKKIKSTVVFDAIADLHNVLRTKILRTLLGKRVVVIEKGRKEKKELTRADDKKLHPIKTMFQRYADVFKRLGLTIKLDIQQGYRKLEADTSLLPFKKDAVAFIGIAPFAKHPAKMYPLHKMEQLIDLLLFNDNMRLLIFTAKNEIAAISSWQSKSDRLFTMAGKYTLEEELAVISQLDVMISMDSANMHLASLAAIPVISVWGGTHPFLGFYGWGQQYENVIQTDMPCRPSSVFGNKDCPVHGAAGCMQQITPEMIYEKVLKVLSRK